MIPGNPLSAGTVRALAPLIAMVAASCGGPTTSSSPPRSGPPQENAEGNEPTATTNTTPAAEATAATCDSSCEKLIANARLTLDRATALRGADQARSALGEKAGKAFERAWRVCLLRVPDGGDRSCRGGPEVVTHLVRSWEMTTNVSGHVLALLVALDPRWRDADGTSTEDELKRSLGELAATGERLAKEEPRSDTAPTALAAAVHAHLAYGQQAAAERAANTYQRAFGRDHRETATLLAVALAEQHLDGDRHRAALDALNRGLAPVATTPPRVQVLWGSARARAQLGLGDAASAVREAQRVVDAWAQVTSPTEAVGGIAPWPMLGRERVVGAVGAAHHVLAEQHARGAAALTAPRYSGPPTHEGVSAFLQQQVAKWAQARQVHIAAATRAFGAVGAIRPVPPERWVVLSHARVGEMNAELAHAMTQIELPATFAGDTAIREAFERTLRTSVVPIVATARESFDHCVQLSEQYRLTALRERCQQRTGELPREAN